jgi:hypothetical protein
MITQIFQYAEMTSMDDTYIVFIIGETTRSDHDGLLAATSRSAKGPGAPDKMFSARRRNGAMGILSGALIKETKDKHEHIAKIR